MFPTGERILRQGLTGSGFYVILDGAADVRIDGEKRATLARGDFFGEVSILLGEPPTADVVATSTRCAASCSPARTSRLPRRPPQGHVPDAPGAGPPAAQRQPLAELIRGLRDPRPFPPGDYPVIVVGSGPGGLQISYGLKHYGVPHAVLSADPSPGGMFRRWPFFQRLLSWTKPYAPEARTSREYQRYDWNSLIAFEPELRSLQAELMDGSSYFPSRPEMEANLAAFADQAGHRRPRTTAAGSARGARTARTGRRSSLETTDGEYRCRYLVLAVGVAEPWSPRRPGIEHARHYAETRDAASYAGKRLFIIGKQNSGFELASGLSSWASKITRRRRRRPRRRRSRPSRWSACAPATCSRSRTTSSGSGCRSSTPRSTASSPSASGFRVNLKRTDNGEAMSVEADEVIAATGLHLPAPGPARPRRHDVRPVEAAGPDADVGVGDGARDLLRRHDQLGGAGPQEARHPVLLRRRPGAPVQRPGPRPAHRRDAVRRRDGAAAGRPVGRAAVPAAGGDLRARAVAPEGLPRPGALGVGGRRHPRRGDPARRPRARRDDRRTWSS